MKKLRLLHIRHLGMDLEEPSTRAESRVTTSAPDSSQPPCLFDWFPYVDKGKGLNHQLSSIGCALAEAHFINRTFVLPAGGFCQTHRTAKESEAGLECIPWGRLLDLGLLSRLAPVVEAESLPAGIAAREVDQGKSKNWSSPALQAIPCKAVPYLRRRMDVHWFSPCFWHRTHSASLVRTAWEAVAGPARKLRRGAAKDLLRPPWLTSILNMLRSGLWFAANIKRAAAAARSVIGPGGYLALHVRRGDRLVPPQCKRSASAGITGRGRANSPLNCAHIDNLTRPLAIREALLKWVPDGTTVFVATADEQPAFFASLQADYRLKFAQDVAPALAAHGVTGSSLTYAAETLLLFGACAVVESFDYYSRPTREACFPAAAALGRQQAAATTSAAVTIGRLASGAAVVNDVLYGAGCVHAQTCRGMQLAPRSKACRETLCSRPSATI